MYQESWWPQFKTERFVPTDKKIEVHHRLPLGIPPSLLPRIFSEVIAIGDVMLLGRWVILARCGAADIRIRHNVGAG